VSQSTDGQLKSHSSIQTTIYSPSKHNSTTVAVCLIAKNETLYIDEWMDFHISLGFKVYLYDNTLTEDLGLRRWYNARKDIQEYVKIIHFPQRPAQNAAYKQCIEHDARNETFVALTDADEFFILKKHDNIVDFMTEHCDETCGQISINWRSMSVSNETNFRPIPILKRNIYSSGTWGTIKVIVRPSYVDTENWDWGHSVRLKKGNWVDTTGKVIPRPGNWRKQANNDAPSDVALLYHYRFKSPSEFYNKNCVRGDVLNSGFPKCTLHNKGANGGKVEQGMYGGTVDMIAWEQLKKMVPKYAIFDSDTNATMKALYPRYPYHL